MFRYLQSVEDNYDMILPKKRKIHTILISPTVQLRMYTMFINIYNHINDNEKGHMVIHKLILRPLFYALFSLFMPFITAKFS